MHSAIPGGPTPVDVEPANCELVVAEPTFDHKPGADQQRKSAAHRSRLDLGSRQRSAGLRPSSEGGQQQRQSHTRDRDPADPAINTSHVISPPIEVLDPSLGSTPDVGVTTSLIIQPAANIGQFDLMLLFGCPRFGQRNRSSRSSSRDCVATHHIDPCAAKSGARRAEIIPCHPDQNRLRHGTANSCRQGMNDSVCFLELIHPAFVFQGHKTPQFKTFREIFNHYRSSMQIAQRRMQRQSPLASRQTTIHSCRTHFMPLCPTIDNESMDAHLSWFGLYSVSFV